MKKLLRACMFGCVLVMLFACGVQEETMNKSTSPSTTLPNTGGIVPLNDVEIYTDTTAPIPDEPLLPTNLSPEVHGNTVVIRLGETDITAPITMTRGQIVQIIAAPFAQGFTWSLQYDQTLLEIDAATNKETPSADGWKWRAKEPGTTRIRLRGSPVCTTQTNCLPGDGANVTVHILP